MKTKQPEINKITALYEYKKDPDDHDHWIIDETACILILSQQAKEKILTIFSSER